MKNKEVAELLMKMGKLLEVQGDIIFKIRAYYKAAENIENLSEDIVKLKEEGRLSEIPGIGKALEEKIIEYLDTGKVSTYTKLTKEIPEGLLEVMEVPSVGPKKAKLFFDHLKVKSLDDLKRAVEGGKLLTLPGIKEKTVENILRGIGVRQESQKRMNLGRAMDVAEQFTGYLQKLPEVKKMAVAGSLRRGKETIRDIDILVQAINAKKVMEEFVRTPLVKTVQAHGDTKSSVLTEGNIQVDLRVVEEKSFGAALLYFTGSKNFNVKLRQIAIKKNMKINEYGIFSVKNDKEKWLAGKTEEDCFKVLGFDYIPPELREEIGEEEIFSGRKIPNLIEEKDIRGELHVHSTYSDGRHTIKEMAETAYKRGYQYLAISDHSPKLRVAGGVSVDDLKKKKKEIEGLNQKMKNFRILFGTEVEIDTEGNLDYNDKILADFDVVIAAIHSGFEQSPQQLTRRLIKACQNKHVHMIAHPTGVHLGKREPYAIDLKEVCKAACDNHVFLEINSFPVRLDLNSTNVYFAKKQGVKFVINTDAHHVDHLKFMRYGIAIARRGWLGKEDVVNTYDLNKLLQHLKKH